MKNVLSIEKKEVYPRKYHIIQLNCFDIDHFKQKTNTPFDGQ